MAPAAEPISLGVAADKHNTLYQKGIVELDDIPKPLVEKLLDLESLQNNDLLLKRETKVLPGVAERVILSLNIPELQKYINTTVAPVLQGYFGRKYVLRGNPRVAFNEPTTRQPADRFHIDYGFHQVTLQVLLNDIDEHYTHMEYIDGSNKSSWFSPRASLFTSKKPEKFMSGWARTKLIGHSGKAFLFDAGNGFHRAKTMNTEGCGRKVLSINFSAGTHLNLPSDIYEDYDRFKSVITDGSGVYDSFRSRVS